MGSIGHDDANRHQDTQMHMRAHTKTHMNTTQACKCASAQAGLSPERMIGFGAT